MKNKLDILYLGNKIDGSSPVDRRRFLGFASLSDDLNIYLDERSGVNFDVLVCALGCDLTKALRLSNSIPKLVFDYTDHYLVEKAWFKDKLRNPVGGILENKEWNLRSFKKSILDLMYRADLVICPSITQKNYLLTIGVQSERITDFFGKEVDFDRVSFEGDGSLFWEGQAGNLKYLKSISPILKERSSLLLRIVSDEKFGMLGGRVFKKNSRDFCREFLPNVEFINWSVAGVNMGARKSSLGIVPLDLTDPFVAAKPENKIVYMWMLGLTTLCSPSESYSMLSNETGVDFLCDNEEEWCSSIDNLLYDQRSRVESARYLHDFARTHYSDQSLQKKWLHAFEKASIL